jgi:hypothetical protein
LISFLYHIQKELSEFHAEAQGNAESLYTVTGELQGHIEDLQCDTSYLAAKSFLRNKHTTLKSK